MEPLLQFYEKTLNFAGLFSDENGFVHSNGTDNPIVTVDGKVLVLPTRSQLTSLNPDKEVYHPLSEDTLLKMTKPLQVYLYRLNGHLNVRFAELVVELLYFACSPSKAVELATNPARLDILKNVQGTQTDDKKAEAFLKFIAGRLADDPSKAFLNITLGRGGQYKGEKQSRVGYVSFNLYNELKEDVTKARKDAKFKQLTKEQAQMLIELYEAVFPGIDKPEEYNYGYFSGPYPFFSTLLSTGLKLGQEMNRVAEAFEGAFSSELEPLELGWVESFENKENLAKMSKMVGRLDGDVEILNKRVANTPAVQVQTSQPAAAPVQAVAAKQPAAAPQPVAAQPPRSGRKTVDMEEWARTRAAPSQMGMQGSMMEAIRRHNEGYNAFYNDMLQRTQGIPPQGYPHPSQIPAGRPAPMYPGCNPAVLAVMSPQMQQAPAMDAWGRPIGMQPGMVQHPVAVDAWGRPIPQQPMMPGMMPMQPQQGYPAQAYAMYQQPQQPGGFARPQQQVPGMWNTMAPTQMGYGQMPQNTSSGIIMPGVV